MGRWRDHHIEPSREEYDDFEKELSKKPSAIESGLTIFLIMLFVMPAIMFLGALASGYFGGYVSSIMFVAALLGASGLSMLQAYRGLVRRRVRVLPKSRIRSETAFVGGKMKEVVTGRAAVVAGAVFFGVGLAALAGAVRLLIWLLQMVAEN